MSFDSVPIWVVFLATVGVIVLALEIGYYMGRRRQQRAGGKAEGAGAMVGATMGLLAFMLAFTFNNASGRHDARKTLVIDEANAIDQAWLRAGFLPEPARVNARAALREYVDVRVKVAAGEMELAPAIQRTEALQGQLWGLAEQAGRADSGSVMASLFIQSLNTVIDLHLKRLTVAVRNRVPPTIWVALYVLACVGMFMMGVQTGLAGSRQFGIELALAVAFAIVLFLIADLDRPQEGLVNVSQQAMIDLRDKLDAR